MIVYENNELLREIQTNRSVIPAYSMTFAENSLYVAEAIEEGYNKLFQSIGINELAVFESTGMQIIYEGEKLQNFKDTVIKFFQDAWAAIKGAFEVALEKFDAMTKEARKNIYKVSADDVDKLANEKNFGKTHNFNIKNRVYGNNACDYADQVSNEFKRLVNKNELTQEEIASKKDELMENICKKVSGLDVSNVTDMKEAIKKDIIGEEIEVTKDFVKKNLNELTGIVIAGNSVKHIKNLYKTSRKYIDNCISRIRKTTDNEIRVAKEEISVLKNILTCMNSANGVALDATKKRYAEYRNILFKVAKACNKINKVSESVEQPFVSQMNMIDEAFNW